jgi:hypothetical protein
MHEMRLRLADLSLRLHPDEQLRPKCEGFQVLDHQPSHLQYLSGVWRDHRRRCEPEGSAHFRNETDQNYLKGDSGDPCQTDPKNLIGSRR